MNHTSQCKLMLKPRSLCRWNSVCIHIFVYFLKNLQIFRQKMEHQSSHDGVLFKILAVSWYVSLLFVFSVSAIYHTQMLNKYRWNIPCIMFVFCLYVETACKTPMHYIQLEDSTILPTMYVCSLRTAICNSCGINQQEFPMIK